MKKLTPNQRHYMDAIVAGEGPIRAPDGTFHFVATNLNRLMDAGLIEEYWTANTRYRLTKAGREAYETGMIV